MKHATYSIIVPAFNEEALLGATLERLNQIIAATPEHGEVIVTDNNSTDRTADIAREHGATVVFEPFQQIATSRNAGAKRSTADYLFFVDADTLVTEELIRESLDALKTGAVSGGGALARFAKGSSNEKAVARMAAVWAFLAKRFKWACGAFVFCRRDAFVALGGFNEKLYASEEIYYSRSVRQWGKPKNMAFIILNHCIETSPRKVEWFGLWGVFKMVLPLLICPWLVRSRRFCNIWYVRPPKG
ncbi:MAG: glycosyltransferase [Mariprofundaceae bacterium]|nr:glycosyltransferase [Mariprofundaceae bacterium]